MSDRDVLKAEAILETARKQLGIRFEGSDNTYSGRSMYDTQTFAAIVSNVREADALALIATNNSPYSFKVDNYGKQFVVYCPHLATELN